MDDEQNQKLAEQTVELYGRKALKQNMQQIDLDWKKQSKRQVLILAGMLWCIMLAVILYYRFQNPANNVPQNLPIAQVQDLFDAHFAPYPIAYIRGEDPVDNRLMDALKAYENKEYQKSILQFTQLDPSNSNIQLYHSNALLAMGAYEEAIPLLQQVAQSEIYATQGKWYLALALIRLNRIEEGRQILSALSRVTNDYQEQALSVLQSLTSPIE